MERFLRSLTILSTGLLAGTFAYAFFAMVPMFYEVPLEAHLAYRTALMRHNGAYDRLVSKKLGEILMPTDAKFVSQEVLQQMEVESIQ